MKVSREEFENLQKQVDKIALILNTLTDSTNDITTATIKNSEAIQMIAEIITGIDVISSK